MEKNNPRVNSALMQQFVGQVVRLPCKIKTVNTDADTVTVEASDGGEVIVKLAVTEQVTETYYEIIGKVTEPGRMNMLIAIHMPGDIDMAIIDKVIGLIHDPRFFTKIFCTTDNDNYPV
ncbi:replication factor A protein 3 [Mucidula mucida]|nr:replication factor A protein 3 [Mucidula mucida]